MDAGRNPKAIHYAVTGSRYGSIAVLVMALGLLAATKWVLRPLNDTFEFRSAGVSRASRPVFAGATIAAVSLAAGINFPRISSSLWGDEEQTVKRMIIGNYERDKNGLGENVKFRRATWADTFFRYKTPNNHVLNSVLSRASHQLFHRDSDDPDALHFSESVLRIPSFLAGLGGVAALGWCVAVLGFPRAGIMAMFLLAIHPWFTRHGVDARGYAFVFLLFPLALGFLVKGLRSGRWHHILLFALFEFLLFLAHPGTIYLLVSLNLAGFLGIVFGKGDRSARLTVAVRLIVANIAATMAVTALMTPNLLQLPKYFESHETNEFVTLSWIANNLSYLGTGMPWDAWNAENPLCHHLSAFSVLSVILFIAVAVTVLVLGIARLARSSRQTLILLIALLLPWPLFILQAWISEPVLYHWYLVMALPGLLILAALGLESIPARIESVRMRDLCGLALLIILSGSYLVFTSPQRLTLRKQAVEPLRESVSASRAVMNPELSEIHDEITVGFCMATRAYDPYAYLFKDDDIDAFKALIARARTENKPLHVNFALPGLARHYYEQMMSVIEDPSIFEPLPPFWGLEKPTTRLVYRLRE